MHGDFSRGHRPDTRRRQTYTRGFAQQRRLLLDSDLNAMTDAIHERLRALSRHASCPKGSPDLGFLVTPGRLLALFRDLEGVLTAVNNLTVDRDYQQKYLDRYPSLHLAADQGGAGSATIRLRAQAVGPTVFWCRAEVATAVTLSGGVALAVPVAADLQPVSVDLGAGVQDLVISLDAGEEIWIGLIEGRQEATLGPRLSIAAGHYYLDGLPLANPADAAWSSNLLPPQANFQVGNPLRDLVAADRLLAYLEGWERNVTAVEDPGILERALGGDTDTATRGRAVGQVKLAWVPPDFDLAALARALDRPVLTGGTLRVTTPQVDADPDPCALPVQGGYTGRDNRLYRFEVHVGAALGAAVFKWSRDNGAELYPVVEATDQSLAFPASTPLQPGDLVEVLTANSVEEGDARPALLDGAVATFTPPVRAVGQLVRLHAPTTTPNGIAFALQSPDGPGAIVLPAHFGPFPASAANGNALKARRWHGLIRTTAVPDPNRHPVENGIGVEIAGAFSPGDYWQYEARAGLDNTNGDFQTSPHGPERAFGPLALLQFAAGNAPLLLERWLDDRFPPLCGLTADDIAFDGASIDSDSDTVQEVIEELWERGGGGCCEFTLRPLEGDAAQAIREILEATQDDVTICLEPGVYTFATVLAIAERKVSLKGCPRAVLAAGGPASLFFVGEGGRLDLENLVLFGRRADGARVLIDMVRQSHALSAREVGFFIAPDPEAEQPLTLAVRVNDQDPSPVDPDAPVPLTVGAVGVAGPAIRFERCVASVFWVVSATSLSALEVADSTFVCGLGCLWAEQVLGVDLRGSDLFARESLAVLQTWTPEDLLARGDALLGGLIGVGGVGVAPPASLAIRIRWIRRGAMSECRLNAGIGVAVTRADAVSLRGNTYHVSHTGLHIVAAEQTLLDGERIGAIHGPALFGVQLLTRGGFSMSDCVVSDCRVGVALGAEAAGAFARQFGDVQVQNNQVHRADVGIQLGPADLNSYPGTLGHVAITENSVTARDVGILINASNAIGSTVRAGHVRVADNLVSARLGLAVVGRHVEVSDNRIHLGLGGGTRFGVLAVDTINLVCQGNRIEVSEGGSAFGGGLGGPVSGAAGLVGAYIAAAAVIVQAAIQIDGGSDATVADNTVHTEGGLSLRGLGVDAHQRLTVKANQFLSGPVACGATVDIAILANVVSGEIRISGGVGGMVADNRIRQREELDFAGNIMITGALGTWKIADNRADGTILIRPPARPRGLAWPDVLIDRGLRPSALIPLVAMATLAGDDRLMRLVQPPIAGEEPAGPVPSPLGVGPSPGPVAMAVGNPEWSVSTAAALVDFVLGGARGIVVDPFPFFAVTVEEPYQVMCSANWGRDIQVGHPGDPARGEPKYVVTNPASTVQVIGNRAEEAIAVQHYQRLIIALNAAHDFPLAGTDAPDPIVQPNLRV